MRSSRPAGLPGLPARTLAEAACTPARPHTLHPCLRPCSEKAIKARLEALEQQQRGGGGATAAEAAAEAERDGDAEEAEREAWLLQADLAALQAAEALGGLQQEAAILRHAAALPPDAREREARERAARGPPPDLVRQLAAAAGNLSSAGAQRQRLVEGVLRPGHQLPTMSVEQFGELEYKRWVGGWVDRCPGSAAGGARLLPAPAPVLRGGCAVVTMPPSDWRTRSLPPAPGPPPARSMLEQQQREEAAKQRREAAEAARTEEEHEEEEVQKVGGLARDPCMAGSRLRLPAAAAARTAACPRWRHLAGMRVQAPGRHASLPSVAAGSTRAPACPEALCTLPLQSPQARAWDDFKDDNPRGWGNSKLRPCA